MKILVVSRLCIESSQKLVEALQANKIDAAYVSPEEYEYGRYGPHILFAYGWSGTSGQGCKKRINYKDPILRCIDKVQTFRALQGKISIPNWETSIDKVPKEWDSVVVRQDRCGRKAEGYAIINQWEGEKLIDGDLFTEYFHHKYEYRVVVFKDNVFVYYKREVNGEHEFIWKDPLQYLDIIRDARKAAKALNIDYVGFDVVAQNKRSYRFLEANSGPILTDEVCEAIVQYFKDQK